MRLLNTRDLALKEFYTNIPKYVYAILSHTWDKDEDVQDLDISKRDLDAGWKKVIGACSHAKKYGFKWIWIDSCCIDKSSSADLSENLNSMYRFYADAAVCYVYLPDASSAENPRDSKSGFRRSKWFTRGWTLQELIAPSYTVFLDDSWKEIGTRYGLRDAISAITSIPVELFENKDWDVTRYSIAQRMSWAAFRETTRAEDRAYCGHL
ncbi:HET-domain-containing protein [Dendrothele bispora CBS 962.96]|uniref:HET-domain-containing protein n=1 Tax=Dendrothele bispora (strain CBS 962.96) TaxID=1314807 RepID=A0A4S8KUY6_DENBC|nr:HET-domain-containing protein [Dendrothele bispora CBS 962.96]